MMYDHKMNFANTSRTSKLVKVYISHNLSQGATTMLKCVPFMKLNALLVSKYQNLSNDIVRNHVEQV